MSCKVDSDKGCPLVTIAIPVYQGEKFIGEAIDSVLAQTFKDFELLVIDNKSIDKTREKVLSYNDPRLTYVCNETNVGPMENWNKCLELARGQYIKLLPHDDLLAPSCLTEQVAGLEENDSASFAFCSRTVINDVGKPIFNRRVRAWNAGMLAAIPLRKACVRSGGNLIGEPGAVLFRRDVAKKAGGFDGSIPYVIDLDYWFRLLSYGDAYYVDKPLCSFRVSAGSWSVNISGEQSKEYTRFMAKISAEKPSDITALDIMRGWVAARISSVARRLFYYVYIR